MPEVEIKDRTTIGLTFNGTLIGDERSGHDTQTGRRFRERWVEFYVYKLDDEPGYVLHKIGKSVIYHTADTRCRTADGEQSGDKATVADLPDEAEPCPVCRPRWPRELGDEEQVRYEFDRNTVSRCDTPERVIDKLTVYRARGDDEDSPGAKVVRTSEPVGRLLAKCAAVDPAFLNIKVRL